MYLVATWYRIPYVPLASCAETWLGYTWKHRMRAAAYLGSRQPHDLETTLSAHGLETRCRRQVVVDSVVRAQFWQQLCVLRPRAHGSPRGARRPAH